MQKFLNKKNIFFLISIFILTFVIGGGVLAFLGGEPFGTGTLAIMDANIQYTDFFGYLRDILLGKNNAFYTLSNLLGGDPISIISYYLLSPFNLLVIFFSKSEIPLFFNIVVLLKWSMAATTFAIFVIKRFENKVSYLFVTIFSISYAFMQYNISQASNLMWLDGVYMLPLIALGVYYAVNKNDIKLLSISVGLTIIFNWYVGAMNCLFSVILLIFELLCKDQDKNLNKIKDFGKSIVNYAFGMLIGIMLSAIIFLPTVIALKSGTRGTLDLGLFSLKLLGNPLNILKSYTFGTISSLGNSALYSGSLALIMGLLIPFYATKLREKLAYVFLLIVSVLILYWNPVYVIFSLFKQVDSYAYRCSYLVCFVLLFCATATSKKLIQADKHLLNVIFFGVVISAVVYCLNYPLNGTNVRAIKLTVISMLILSFLLVTYIKFKKLRMIFGITVLLFSTGEVAFNIYQLSSSIYKLADGDSFSKYEKDQEKQIEEIKNSDTATYRISQLLNRGQSVGGLTANYNESLAFNYFSIAGYSSSPEIETMKLLNNLGYRSEQDRITVVNTSVLSADSLLGVKYILANNQIGDLEKVNEFGKINNKYVYKNQYTLPMAFAWNYKDTNSIEDYNTFDYQNELYSKILGEKVKLYTPVEYTSKNVGNGLEYTLRLPSGHYMFYGNIPWQRWINNCQLIFSDNSSIHYAGWLSQGVFNIPTSNNAVSTTVTMKADDSLMIQSPQFYALNLDVLQYIHDKITSKSAKLDIEDTKITATIKNPKNDSLFISIPYNKNWNVTINGKDVSVAKVANSLMSIPLEKGKNEVVLTYNNKTIIWGLVVTIVGILLLIVSERLLYCRKI